MNAVSRDWPALTMVCGGRFEGLPLQDVLAVAIDG